MIKGKGQLNFTNVFTTLVEYVYKVDNPAFTVGKGEKLAPKKVAKISISFKNAPTAIKNARLTISSPNVPYTWLYYLQALDEEPRYCHLLDEDGKMSIAKKGDKKDDNSPKKGDKKEEKGGSKQSEKKGNEKAPKAQANKKEEKTKKKAA